MFVIAFVCKSWNVRKKNIADCGYFHIECVDLKLNVPYQLFKTCGNHTAYEELFVKEKNQNGDKAGEG